MNRPLAPVCVFVGLIVLAAGSRLIGAEANFAAVAAAALFAGFYFQNRLAAIGVPIAAMLVSDAVIGFYDVRLMAVVYAMLCLPILCRGFVARPTVVNVLGCSLFCSVAFFLFTNLAVWAFGTMYAKSPAGLLECYAAAVPFFRNTMMSDLVYSVALFGGHALLARQAAAFKPAIA